MTSLTLNEDPNVLVKCYKYLKWIWDFFYEGEVSVEKIQFRCIELCHKGRGRARIPQV